MTNVDDVIRRMTKQPKPKLDLLSPDVPRLSSGATLLNLAVADDPVGAYPVGEYVLFAGDSNSGKTWFTLSALAEAAADPRFAKYDLVLDPPEGGALMNVRRFFGDGLANRLVPPSGNWADPDPSATVEQFWDRVEQRAKRGPTIYVLDSMDVLQSEEDVAYLKKTSAARARGKTPEEGTYGVSRAKVNSIRARGIPAVLKKHGSLLFVVAQSRDKIGATMFDPIKKTRSGGNALSFYAAVELWSRSGPQIKLELRGRKRQTGITSRVEIRRSRINGRSSTTVDVPIYHQLGIDDVGSTVDWIIADLGWPKGKRKSDGKTVYRASSLGLVGTRDEIVAAIEAENREDELRVAAGELWSEIRRELDPGRKPRYQ